MEDTAAWGYQQPPVESLHCSTSTIKTRETSTQNLSSGFWSEHTVKNSPFYRIIDLKLSSDTKSHQRKKNTPSHQVFWFSGCQLRLSQHLPRAVEISDLSPASCFGEEERGRERERERDNIKQTKLTRLGSRPTVMRAVYTMISTVIMEASATPQQVKSGTKLITSSLNSDMIIYFSSYHSPRHFYFHFLPALSIILRD